jgi:hypothetical protein
MSKESAKKLPRGFHRRGSSIEVSFALADGRIERRSLGPVTLSYAKQQREIFRREVSEGRYTKRQPRPPKVTTFVVADLWEGYLREYRNQGKKDAGRLEIAWNHLKPKFEKMPIADVTTDSVNQYIETRRAQGVQNATVNPRRRLSAPCSITELASRRQWLTGCLPSLPASKNLHRVLDLSTISSTSCSPTTRNRSGCEL